MTVPEAANSAVATVLDGIYDCLEQRRFTDLPSVLGIDELDLYGRRVSAQQLSECLSDRLDGAVDISLFLMRMLEQRAESDVILYRGTACLLWSPSGSWEDEELEFDVATEFVRESAGTWSLSGVTIEEATPELIPPSGDPSPSTVGGES